MFKLFILSCLMAVAIAEPEPKAKPGVFAPVAYTAAYTAPVAYSAAYTAPVAYSAAYTAPVAYSPYTYASPYAYYLR